MTRVIGLDPGLRTTGWGVIEVVNNRISHVAHGIVTSVNTLGLAERLAQLYSGLRSVCEEYQPEEASVEETFINSNPTSTLKLGAARGVVLLAPAMFGLAVAEYSANRIKKAIAGVGHADKEQVAMMVQMLLPLAGPVKRDAADALAVALCHAHYRQTLKRYQEKAQ